MYGSGKTGRISWPGSITSWGGILPADEGGREAPDLERFQELVEEALEGFPEKFLKLIQNVAVIVEEVATPQDAATAGVRNPITLFGLYIGVPFTKWGREWSGHLPDVIKIYRR